ncbi:hypothetical protein [Acidaminococcus timonensis]|jgi:hypothetical protein|uniref:hypothetical protein n=1 Tax=Acidaminococcus TaxID=904 RepID=UPI0025DF87D6|nr:hypothetical protein [Acidaminococcus timonensis]MDD6570438.1 hypothetical protein [Acidaminococcus sp.]
MKHSFWSRFLLTLMTAFSVCGSALAAGAIPVPKPGRIGATVPRPTVPIGDYQKPGTIPTPMMSKIQTPVHAPVQSMRPVRMNPIPLRPIVQPMTGEIGSLATELPVFKPNLTLFSWAAPVDIGSPMGSAFLHNPKYSLAWWKTPETLSAADLLQSRMARLVETKK